MGWRVHKDPEEYPAVSDPTTLSEDGSTGTKLAALPSFLDMRTGTIPARPEVAADAGKLADSRQTAMLDRPGHVDHGASLT